METTILNGLIIMLGAIVAGLLNWFWGSSRGSIDIANHYSQEIKGLKAAAPASTVENTEPHRKLELS